MTCATSLSSLLYSSSTQSIQWERLSQAIPIILSSEYEMAEKIKQYLEKKFIPKGLGTVYKMLLMEIWRSFWLNTFRLMRKYFHYISGENYYDSLWESYAPGWLRRGVRSYFVKKVQGRLQNVIYGWVTRGWEVVSIGFGYSWLDFEIIQDGQTNLENHDARVTSDDSLEDVSSSTDGSAESQHHDLLDEMDIELEMEFEDDSLLSAEESFENSGDDVISDDSIAINPADDIFGGDHDFSDCPENEEC
jgi:hypothetical protein